MWQEVLPAGLRVVPLVPGVLAQRQALVQPVLAELSPRSWSRLSRELLYGSSSRLMFADKVWHSRVHRIRRCIPALYNPIAVTQ